MISKVWAEGTNCVGSLAAGTSSALNAHPLQNPRKTHNDECSLIMAMRVTSDIRR